MGSYPQRQRAGGSNTAAATQIPFEMISSVYQGARTIEIRYSGPTSHTLFTPGQHRSDPSGNASTGYESSGFPDRINVNFAGTSMQIATDTSIFYSGNVPHIKSPQTLPR